MDMCLGHASAIAEHVVPERPRNQHGGSPLRIYNRCKGRLPRSASRLEDYGVLSVYERLSPHAGASHSEEDDIYLSTTTTTQTHTTYPSTHEYFRKAERHQPHTCQRKLDIWKPRSSHAISYGGLSYFPKTPGTIKGKSPAPPAKKQRSYIPLIAHCKHRDPTAIIVCNLPDTKRTAAAHTSIGD
jgi:hypothetical protein